MEVLHVGELQLSESTSFEAFCFMDAADDHGMSLIFLVTLVRNVLFQKTKK